MSKNLWKTVQIYSIFIILFYWFNTVESVSSVVTILFHHWYLAGCREWRTTSWFGLMFRFLDLTWCLILKYLYFSLMFLFDMGKKCSITEIIFTTWAFIVSRRSLFDTSDYEFIHIIQLWHSIIAFNCIIYGSLWKNELTITFLYRNQINLWKWVKISFIGGWK